MSENNTDNVTSIVENNTGLVYTVAQKFGKNGADFDDLVSAGFTGLLSGAQKVDSGEYDSEKSKLSTFLSVWISGAIRRELKNLNNTVRVPEHALTAGVTVECGSIPEEFDVADQSNESALSSDMTALLGTISEEDKTLLIRNVVNGESVRAIGASLGVSGAAVSKRIRRIREELLSNA
jgi:RNA polymerase sigma factor (sigma-70 family)